MTALLSVSLEAMDKPHDLSAFILRLAKWRKLRATAASMSASDERFCSKLSSFIYEQGLRGTDLTQNAFRRHDFECIVSVISDGAESYDADWLWNVILELQSKNRKQPSETKLGWVDNEWSKFQTLSACQDTQQPQQARCTSALSKCKHFKHVLGVLHFQQLCADRIAEDPRLLLQYLQHIDIYQAYLHLMTAHDDDDKKELSRVMSSLVQCDEEHCRAKKERKSKRTMQCVERIRSHQGVSEFYPEFVDIMHLVFLHKMKLV